MEIVKNVDFQKKKKKQNNILKTKTKQQTEVKEQPVRKATVHLDHGTGKREVFTLPIVFETTSGFALAIGEDMKGGQSNLRTEWFPKSSAKCHTVMV